MACYCGVCGCRLSDATENEGGFQTTREFKGWYVTEKPRYEWMGGPRAVIENSCEDCAKILREAVTKAANKIVEKNAEKVAVLSKMLQDDRAQHKKAEEEEAAFRRDWYNHRSSSSR